MVAIVYRYAMNLLKPVLQLWGKTDFSVVHVVQVLGCNYCGSSGI